MGGRWGKADYTIPLKHGKGDKVEKKLLMEIASGKDEPAKLTFKIAWGNHHLTAHGKFHFGNKKAEDAAAKKKEEKK